MAPIINMEDLCRSLAQPQPGSSWAGAPVLCGDVPVSAPANRNREALIRSFAWLRPRSFRDKTFVFNSRGGGHSLAPCPAPRLNRMARPVLRLVPLAKNKIESATRQASAASVEACAVDSSSDSRPTFPGMVDHVPDPFAGFQFKRPSDGVTGDCRNSDAHHRLLQSTPETRHLTLRDLRLPKPSKEQETRPFGTSRTVIASGYGLNRQADRHQPSVLATARNTPLRRYGLDSRQNVLAGERVTSLHTSFVHNGQVTNQRGDFPVADQGCRDGNAETHEGGML